MITVYSRPKCMPCKFTKQFLIEHNIPFKNVDVSEEPEALEILKQHGFLQCQLWLSIRVLILLSVDFNQAN